MSDVGGQDRGAVAAEPETPVPPRLPPIPTAGEIPQLRPGWPMLASLVAGLLISMGELDRLIAQAPDVLGRSWSLGDLMGPGRLADGSLDGWLALADIVRETSGVGAWIAAYLLLDLTLIALYLLLGLRLRRRVDQGSPARRRIGWALIVLATVDLAEDLAAVLALRTGARWAAWAPTVLSMAKWVAVIVVALMALPAAREGRGTPLPRLARIGLYIQRYSLFVVLPILLLGVFPGPNLLDQLPDVERRWADASWPSGHAWAAVALTYAVGVLVFGLGRLRGEFAWRRYTPGPSGDSRTEMPDLHMWFIGPLLLGAGAAVLATLGIRGIRWCVLVGFCAVPVAIGVTSWCIRRLLGGAAPSWCLSRWVVAHAWRKPKPSLSRAEFRAVSLSGDLIAGLVLAVGGLSLLRAFTAPVALMTAEQTPARVLPVSFLVAGWAGLLLNWVPACGGMNRVTGWGVTGQRIPPPYRAWQHRAGALLTPGVPIARHSVRFGVLAGSITTFLVLCVFVGWFARLFGVVGCMLIALACLALLVGAMVVIAQDGGAPYVFWLPGIRLSSPPITTLLVLAIFAVSLFGGSEKVHGVRGQIGDAALTAQRPTLEAQFRQWLESSDTCQHVVKAADGTELRLRPMMLIAAEGGGIRAAYWTAASLDVITGRAALPRTSDSAEGSCIRPTALLSAGASGGAVGLTVRAVIGDAESSQAAVEEMAGPDMLAVGSVGLLARDLTYSATGLPMPTVDLEGPGRGLATAWADRAALMERSWEASVPELGHDFLNRDARRIAATPTGALVLNSTSVANGCRLWVSQLQLAGVTLGPKERLPLPQAAPDSSKTTSDTAPAGAACSDRGAPGPQSVDLFDAYGPTGAAATGSGCLKRVTASTAAMLASRFPYVTPSGVIGPCGVWSRQQVVDGGYVENSGLGTIIDLSPIWLRLVQSHNERELTAPSSGAGGGINLIVPIIVYLDNGTGSDLTEPTRDITNELLVPPVTNSRAGRAQSDTSALLARAASLVSPEAIVGPAQPSVGAEFKDSLLEARRRTATMEIKAWRKYPAMVVHQSAFPAVTAPLGWALSNDSISTMQRALGEQASTQCEDELRDALCRRGYGSLADLLDVLGRTVTSESKGR